MWVIGVLSLPISGYSFFIFFFQAEDGIRDYDVTGVQTCALPISGVAILRKALEEPLRQIVINAGQEGSIVIQKVREGKNAFGYNAATEQYEDLLKSGVIDPKKVVRVALENAASIAGMLLTTECVLADEKEDEPAMPGGMPPGGMGGMM